jgi:hypothetical protein
MPIFGRLAGGSTSPYIPLDHGGGSLMSRVCIACGLLCELVQVGTSLSWQLDLSNVGLGLLVGLAGLAPTANHLGAAVFSKLTGETPLP